MTWLVERGEEEHDGGAKKSDGGEGGGDASSDVEKSGGDERFAETMAAVAKIVESGGDSLTGHPVCATCSGCSVDWRGASDEAQKGAGCRGHGECGSCDVNLNRINETYGLKRFAKEKTVRDTGASSATVIRADLAGIGDRPPTTRLPTVMHRRLPLQSLDTLSSFSPPPPIEVLEV